MPRIAVTAAGPQAARASGMLEFTPSAAAKTRQEIEQETRHRTSTDRERQAAETRQAQPEGGRQQDDADEQERRGQQALVFQAMGARRQARSLEDRR